jgi:hypothetical protein
MFRYFLLLKEKMSIYIYTSKIRELLGDRVRYKLPDDQLNSIVATGIKGKKPHILKFEKYSEENLIALVKKHDYKHLYVDYRFWNYKYCSPDNLQIENLKYMIEMPRSIEPYIQTHKFYMGMVVITIMYYSILYHSLMVSDKLFKNYMSLINIDKNDFSRFLIQSSIYFPLTKNYLTLIKRVFTDQTIGEYLFPEDGAFYTSDQTRVILSLFTIRDIRDYVKLIYLMDENLENKYYFLEIVFDLFDGSIDEYKKVYATENMEFKPVGYYLEQLSPTREEDLDNLYQLLIEKYASLDGAETVELF